MGTAINSNASVSSALHETRRADILSVNRRRHAVEFVTIVEEQSTDFQTPTGFALGSGCKFDCFIPLYP